MLDLVAEVGEKVEALRAAGRISHFIPLDHAFCVRDVKVASLMLGVNATTDSYRFNESRLAPNIGLEAVRGLHTPN